MGKKERKFCAIGDMVKEKSFFTENLFSNFDIWIERLDKDNYKTSIITTGGANKKDISADFKFTSETNIFDLKNMALEYCMTHKIFDSLKTNNEEEEKTKNEYYKVKNYALIDEVNKLISMYAKMTSDEEFKHIDEYVFEYIDDRLSDPNKYFPYKCYEKWDDVEKLIKLKELIIKNTKEQLIKKGLDE